MQPSNRTSRRSFLVGTGAAFGAQLAAGARGAEPTPSPPAAGEAVRTAIANAPMAMKFTGRTAEEGRQWQAAFRSKLRELLGPCDPPQQWRTTVRSTAKLDGFRREDLLLEADGFSSLPVYLLLPDNLSDRRAGIVALHGHGEFGHHAVAGRDDLPGVQQAIAGSNYDYGRQLARRGYVVACPCLMPFGERLGKREAFGKQDPCGDVFIRLLALGRVLMGENLRDALWALNLLVSRPEVDPVKLGCVGLSLGGRMTMLTAAMEPRIKVAAVSGALNVMQERLSQPYGCGAQIIPGLLQYGDVPEIGSLIAPRPAVWEVGSRDGLVKQPWADEAVARMRRAYQAFSAPDRLLVDRFEGGHQWHGEVAYDVLNKTLA